MEVIDIILILGLTSIALFLVAFILSKLVYSFLKEDLKKPMIFCWISAVILAIVTGILIANY